MEAERFSFSRGDVGEALSVMREAAEWLIAAGKPLWEPSGFEPGRFKDPPEHFLTLRGAAGRGIAAALLSFEDNCLWPDVPPQTSGFLHKLAVRRAYAGQGMAERMIGYAVSLCREAGLDALRLDCDAERPSLCAFYEKAGFALVARKKIETKRLGLLHIALYKMDL